MTINQLASIEDWERYSNYTYYASKELGPEARELMSKLYAAVTEKRFNMNEVLDDIIKSSPGSTG
jgi:hypothetical protein